MDRDKGVAVIGTLWVAADAEPAAGPVELETVTVTETKIEHPALSTSSPPPTVPARTSPSATRAGSCSSRICSSRWRSTVGPTQRSTAAVPWVGSSPYHQRPQ